MKLKIAQVIGLNTDQKAAQVISSSRNGDNSFFAVLDLACDDAFTKGRLGLSELSDFYFDFESGSATPEAGSAGEKLKASFKEAQEKFPEGEFSLLIAAISGKILYLLGKGEIEVYLKRGENLSALLSVGAPSELISGFLQEGDKLLFSTRSLIILLASDLEKSLSLPPETFEEEIMDRIGASDLENQGLAALAIEIEPGEEQEKKEQSIPSLEQEEQSQEEQSQEEQSQEEQSPSVNLAKVGSGIKKIFARYFLRSGRGRLILAVILIIIIALGIGFKIKSAKDAQIQASFNLSLQQAKDDFNKAKGLASLNPAEAKTKLDSANDKLNKALNLKPNDADAQNLKKQIETESASILQEASVSDFPLFLDMDLIKKNFRAVQMSLSSGKLLLADPVVKTLVALDLAKKSNQILAGSQQLGEAAFASLNGELAFVYSKDKGILRIDSAKQKVTQVAKVDEDWGDIKDLYAFAGNVYLLDSTKGQIWKYLPTSEGYSDKREYLTKATTADFSNALRMQIESSVYILKQKGEILRFTRGEKDHFSLGGLPSAVKDPKSLFISSDTDNLYLLDSGNSRMLILTKVGAYKGQITGSKFASATDLVVDEKGKKVYLLEGSKIYTADLK